MHTPQVSLRPLPPTEVHFGVVAIFVVREPLAARELRSVPVFRDHDPVQEPAWLVAGVVMLDVDRLHAADVDEVKSEVVDLRPLEVVLRVVEIGRADAAAAAMDGDRYVRVRAGVVLVTRVDGN